MPTILRIRSYRFFFFSNESDEPVHIHVESDNKYAKFWLEPVQVARSIGYNARELNNLTKIILQNKEIFKEKWDGYFSGK